jgi:hypothetical protein
VEHEGYKYGTFGYQIKFKIFSLKINAFKGNVIDVNTGEWKNTMAGFLE